MMEKDFGRSFQHYENYYEASKHATDPARFHYAIAQFFYEGIEPEFEAEMDQFLWKMVSPSIAKSKRNPKEEVEHLSGIAIIAIRIPPNARPKNPHPTSRRNRPILVPKRRPERNLYRLRRWKWWPIAPKEDSRTRLDLQSTILIIKPKRSGQ